MTVKSSVDEELAKLKAEQEIKDRRKSQNAEEFDTEDERSRRRSKDRKRSAENTVEEKELFL